MQKLVQLRPYLKYFLGLAILAYGIRKNPFYRSYPIMLPVMGIAFFGVFVAMYRRSRKLNNVVTQVLLDPSGQELTFVF